MGCDRLAVQTLYLQTIYHFTIFTGSSSGHPKTRAFITHAGINGITEAIYHGVPVVGIPLFGEQADNMVHMVARGTGITLDLNTMTAEHLRDAINKVIIEKS